MLKCFFEDTMPLGGRDTRALFRGLKIEEAGERYMERQGKYPVVFLSFKEAKMGNFDLSYNRLKGCITEEFSRHDYVAEKIVKAADLKMFESLSSGDGSIGDFAYAARIDGGKYVGLMLNRHVDTIERSGYLVKISAAQKQIDAEEEARRREQERVAAEGSAPAAAPSANTYQPPIGSAPANIEEVHKNTAFYMCYVIHDKNNGSSGIMVGRVVGANCVRPNFR